MGRKKGSKNKVKEALEPSRKIVKLVVTQDKNYRAEILKSKYADISFCTNCRMKLAECVCH